ncbi:MAG: homoserine dehydrogenase [Acidimicrobiia bacterium]|nr:homoserine dehydrogenase [Acidimicrobiia bacterium]
MDPGIAKVGLLGCGTVGGALVGLIDDQRDAIAERTGLRLEVASVAVRNTARPRTVELGPDVLTNDAMSVVEDPAVDVVVELIGGIEPARELILTALQNGKAVVTGNKELLANVGGELFEAAEKAGVDLLFEAAVAGGIPLIRPLRESLAGERVQRILGIVNGTTNFILTRMTEEGSTFHDALAEAQALGYAERDPTADVEGFDAAAKAAIIATVAFGVRVVAGDVYREGISGVTPADIAFAQRLGYVVKLLAVAAADERGVAVRVYPAMVPKDHPLAAVRESFNAVFIEGAAVGDLMLYGRGAGGRPTASAVLGDVIDAAANRRRGAHAGMGLLGKARIRHIEELSSEYYVALEVVDRPGVLAAVAGVFGTHGVSIKQMEQEGIGDDARLILITHTAVERAMQATLSELRDLDVVDRVGSLLRVVGWD